MDSCEKIFVNYLFSCYHTVGIISLHMCSAAVLTLIDDTGRYIGQTFGQVLLVGWIEMEGRSE